MIRNNFLIVASGELLHELSCVPIAPYGKVLGTVHVHWFLPSVVIHFLHHAKGVFCIGGVKPFAYATFVA